MKTIIKGVLAIVSLIIGLFLLLIGNMGDEGAPPPPFWLYMLLVILFAIPIALVIAIAREKKKR
jgi:membrane-bound ClpP family serine protease